MKEEHGASSADYIHRIGIRENPPVWRHVPEVIRNCALSLVRRSLWWSRLLLRA